MNDSIRLHPEKGVNPRLTVCSNCGKDVGLAILGIDDKVYECTKCHQMHIGKPTTCHCGAEYRRGEFKLVRVLGEHEKLAIEVCDECVKKEEASDAAVKAGGIYWKCKACGSHGAIKAESPICSEVRKKSGIPAPGLVGIEMDECQVCTSAKTPTEELH